MINFRYHVVSLIAVFLALGVGVIMGTAVIDRAVVDRLERQQDGLQADVDEVRSENNRLRGELREERQASQRFAEEGGERLLDGALMGVPVLLVGVRGAEAEGFDELVTLIGRADAEHLGTLWLTDRFALESDDELTDLAEALAFRPDASAGTLRSAAITRLARALRPTTGLPPDDAPDVIADLREAGFLDFEAPEGGDAEAVPVVGPSTRVLVVSGAAAPVPNVRLTLPLVRSLVAPRDDHPAARVLAATGVLPTDREQDENGFVGPIRSDDGLSSFVSTVDDIDDFAGRVAAVLALADLADGRIGHYGRGAGAQRLLPAPAE